MAIVADSGAIYALYDKSDTFHTRVRSVVERERDLILLPAPILGEIDYLLRARLGNAAHLRFLEDIEQGAFSVENVTSADLRRCAALVAKYRDMDLGLADASVAAVAERVGTDRILTVDERDFRTIRPAAHRPFRLILSERKNR